jgi:hypothetical protein
VLGGLLTCEIPFGFESMLVIFSSRILFSRSISVYLSRVDDSRYKNTYLRASMSSLASFLNARARQA